MDGAIATRAEVSTRCGCVSHDGRDALHMRIHTKVPFASRVCKSVETPPTSTHSLIQRISQGTTRKCNQDMVHTQAIMNGFSARISIRFR